MSRIDRIRNLLTSFKYERKARKRLKKAEKYMVDRHEYLEAMTDHNETLEELDKDLTIWLFEKLKEEGIK